MQLCEQTNRFKLMSVDSLGAAVVPLLPPGVLGCPVVPIRILGLLCGPPPETLACPCGLPSDSWTLMWAPLMLWDVPEFPIKMLG